MSNIYNSLLNKRPTLKVEAFHSSRPSSVHSKQNQKTHKFHPTNGSHVCFPESLNKIHLLNSKDKKKIKLGDQTHGKYYDCIKKNDDETQWRLQVDVFSDIAES